MPPFARSRQGVSIRRRSARRPGCKGIPCGRALDGTTRTTIRRGGPLEQIAIVGIGCRLPGNSEGPDAYWQNLLAGRDLISETSKAPPPVAEGMTVEQVGSRLITS